jgi:hypothetical protein
MKYISSFISKFIPKKILKPTGRWNIEQCNKKMNIKIDLSNEDHCGPCGQYAITQLELNNKNIVHNTTKLDTTIKSHK